MINETFLAFSYNVDIRGKAI